MPPENYEPRSLFYKNSKGEYVQFELKTIDFADIPTIYNVSPLWTETGELSFSLTFKSSRRLRKMMRSDANRLNRIIRRFYRKREKIRRNRLKGVS